MANDPPFYQEVLDALAGGTDPDLILLRDLCVAVEADRQSRASPLVTSSDQTSPAGSAARRSLGGPVQRADDAILIR